MVQLSWAAPDYLGTGELTYHLFRNGALVWSGIGLAHSDTGLANFVTFTYELSASNPIGWGPNGTAVQAMPLPDEMTPSAPYGIEVTEGNGNLTLAWDAPIYSNASSIVKYVVHYGTASSSLPMRVESIQPFSVIDGLEKGRTYYLVIAAQNNAGLGPNSSQAIGTPFGVPSSPSGVSAEAGDAYVFLSWTAPAYQGPGPMAYHLYRDGALIWTGASLSHNDTLLTNGVAYHYQVAAENSIGLGAISEEVSATPNEGPAPPSAPTGLNATPGDRRVTLTWSPPAESGSFAVIGYKIYRGSPPDGLMYLTTVTATSYSDGGLINGQDYYYQVSAYSEAGEGPATDPVHAVPMPGGSSGFDTTLLIVLITVAVVAVAAAVVLMRRRR